MMRCVLFVLFLTGCSSVFGQSPKKLNKQLRAEYLVEKQKYDSISGVFFSDRTFLEALRDKVHDQIFGPLVLAENKANRSVIAFENYKETLKELGFDTRTILPDTTFLKYRYATARELLEFHKEALREHIRFDIEKEIVSNLNQYRIKEQNDLLAERVSGYRNCFESNQLNIRDQREYMTELEGFEPQLDRLIGVYEELVMRLETANRTLAAKLKELETQYKLKGPKGFSPAYQRVFAEGTPVKSLQGNVGMEDIPEHSQKEYEVIYNYVDEPAEFPGGMEEMNRYLQKNLHYPTIARELGISGKVFIRFIVTYQGKISSVEILRGVPDCPECDHEALRVVKAMPDWIPAKIGSKMVNSFYVLPIWFKL